MSGVLRPVAPVQVNLPFATTNGPVAGPTASHIQAAPHASNPPATASGSAPAVQALWRASTQTTPDRSLDQTVISQFINSTLDLIGANYRPQVRADGVEIGSWSEGINSYWDTSIALITEIELGQSSPETVKGLANHILSLQRPDGSWADYPGKQEGGATVSALNHSALVHLLKNKALKGDREMFDRARSALQKSWSYLVGHAPTTLSGLLQAPPQNVFDAVDPFAQVLCHLVFPKISVKLDAVTKSLVQFGPKHFGELYRRDGVMPQVRDILFSMPFLLSFRDQLGQPEVQAFREPMLRTFSESGLNCYQPFFTSLVLLALHRDLKNHPENSALIDRSLGAVRQYRRSASGGIRVENVIFNAFYNVTYLIAKLTQNPYALRDPQVMAGLHYVLSCQTPDGRFQGAFEADEAEDAESPITGSIIALLGLVGYLLQAVPDILPEEEKTALLTKIVPVVGQAVSGLVAAQNADGGFSTFRKTDKNKAKPGAATPLETYIDFGSPELSGMALQGLALSLALGDNPPVKEAVGKGLAWLRDEFVPGAGWWSRYGLGYFFGTSQAIAAFKLAGVNMAEDEQVQEIIKLVRTRQNQDGGWGEDISRINDVKNDPFKFAMRGESHPALAGHAIMILLNAGVSPRDPAVVDGVNYLLRTFNDPKSVTQVIQEGQGESLSFADQDRAAWSSPYGLLEAIPGWVVEDSTITDITPVLALQAYLTALNTWPETQ